MLETSQFILGAVSPLGYFFDVGSRVYWLHWFTAALCTYFVVRTYSVSDRREVTTQLFDRGYWFNRSTASDYGLMIFNGAIRAALWLPLIGSYLVGTLFVARTLRDNFGFPDELIWDPIVITVVYTVSYFLIDDLSRFLVHLAMHKVPLLWRLHRVHHSATTLTPFTVFRVHPLESGIYLFRAFFVFSLISGVFVWSFGRHLSFIDVIGVNALGFLANAAFANLRHSHIWVGFGRLERILISPAQHQLHHAAGSQRVNYGSVLSLWDLVMGTLTFSGQRKALEFGIDERREKATL